MGYLLGIPVLPVTTGALFRSLTDTMQVLLPVRLNVWYMLLGFVIVTITHEFAKIMCRNRVARIPMSEALKSGTK